MKRRPFKISYRGYDKFKITQDEERKCYFYELGDEVSSNQELEHHLILIGLTESMAGSMESIKKSLKDILQQAVGDERQYISIIVFGGHHSAYTLFLGIKAQASIYQKRKIYKSLEEICTGIKGCIVSEALEYAGEELKKIEHSDEMRHHLYLILDEESIPLEWSILEEEQRCCNIVNAYAKSKMTLDAVGIGCFYNRNFLIKLVQKGRGKLLHADNIKEGKKLLSRVIKERRGGRFYSTPRKGKKAFLTKICEDIAPGEERSGGEACHLLVAYDEPLKQIGIEANLDNKKADEKVKQNFLYSLAAYEFRQGHIDKSLEILGQLGDKHTYNMVRNSYTMTEQGRTQNFLDELAKHPEMRYKKGRQTIDKEYIEKSEHLCLLELLNLIMDDSEAELLWDYGIKYEYSGIKKHILPSEYIFIKPEEGYGKVDKLIIGGRKLNIGVRVKIKGQVEDSKTHLKLDAAIYREYHLAVNGNLKTDVIWCQLSRPLKRRLRREKLIKKCFRYGNKEINVLNIKKMKLLNKRIEESLSETQIVEILDEVEEIKLREKIIKEFINELKEKSDLITKGYSLSEIEYSKLRKQFKINEKGIFVPQEVREEEGTIKTYRGTVIEWKVENLLASDREKQIRDYYKINMNETDEEKQMRLKAELKLLKYERYKKELLVQSVRLTYGIRNREFKVWDEKKMVAKKNMDRKLGINRIIGGEKEVTRRRIAHLIFKQERYETLIQCSLSV